MSREVTVVNISEDKEERLCLRSLMGPRVSIARDAEKKTFSQRLLWSMHSRGLCEDLNWRDDSCKMFAARFGW